MINSKVANENQIAVYNDGELELKISISRETIWLNANDIAALFDVQRPAIVKHIGNIYKTDELSKNTTCSILEQVVLIFRGIMQYNNLIIKKSNKYHDRFLILDKNEAYHIGASLKDLGKKVFGFSKINTELLMDGIDE